jgi:chromosome segregation ATPase
MESVPLSKRNLRERGAASGARLFPARRRDSDSDRSMNEGDDNADGHRRAANGASDQNGETYYRVPSDLSMQDLENAFDEEVESLRMEKNTYLDLLKKAQNELDDLKVARDNEVTELRKRIVEARIENELTQKKFRGMQEEVDLTTAKYEATLTEVERLKLTNQSLRDDRGGNADSFHEAKLQLESRIRILVDEKVQLSQSLRKAESEKRSKSAEHAELRLKFEEALTEAEFARTELEDTINENTELSSQLQFANDALVECQEMLASVNKDNKAMSDKFIQTERRLLQRISDLESELTATRDSMTTATDESANSISELHAQIGIERERIAELLRGMQSLRDDVNIKTEELESVRAEMHEIDGSITVLRNECEQTELALQQCAAEKSQLESSGQELQRLNDDLNLELQSALDNFQFLENELRVEIEFKNSLASDNALLVASVRSLEFQVEQGSESSLEIIAEKAALVNKLQVATADLSFEREKIHSMTQELVKSEELLKLMEQSLELERAKAAKLSREMEETLADTANVETRASVSHIELLQLTEINTLLCAQCDDTKTEIAKLRTERGILIDEIDINLAEIETLKEENHDLSSMIVDLENEGEDRKKEIERLILANTDLKQAKASLQSELRIVTIEKDNLIQLEASHRVELESAAAVVAASASFYSTTSTQTFVDEHAVSHNDSFQSRGISRTITILENKEKDNTSPDRNRAYDNSIEKSLNIMTIQVGNDSDYDDSDSIQSGGSERSNNAERNDSKDIECVEELQNIFNEEIGVLAHSNSKFKVQLHSVQSELRECRERIQELMLERDGLVERSQTMTTVLFSMQEAKFQVDMSLVAAVGKAEEYLALLQSSQAKFSKLEQEHSAVLQESQEANDSLSKLNDEHKVLLEESIAMKIANRTLENELDRLKLSMESSQRAQMISDTEALQRLHTIENELKILRESEQQVSDDFANSESHRTALIVQLEELTESRNSLMAELDSTRAVYGKKLAAVEVLMAERLNLANVEIESLQQSLYCIQRLQEEQQADRADLLRRLERGQQDLYIQTDENSSLRERLRISESNHKATITAMMTILGLPEASTHRIIGTDQFVGSVSMHDHDTVTGSWNNFIDSIGAGGNISGNGNGNFHLFSSSTRPSLVHDADHRRSEPGTSSSPSNGSKLRVDMLATAGSAESASLQLPRQRRSSSYHSNMDVMNATQDTTASCSSKSNKLWQYAILSEIMRQMEIFKSLQLLDDELCKVDVVTWEQFIGHKISASVFSSDDVGYSADVGRDYTNSLDADGLWEPDRAMVRKVAPIYLRRKLIKKDVVHLSAELKLLVDELATILHSIEPGSRFPVTPLTHESEISDSLRGRADFAARFVRSQQGTGAKETDLLPGTLLSTT